MKISSLLLLLLPTLGFSQIRDAYKINSSDTLYFNGSVVKLPATNSNQCCRWMVEFNKEYQCNGINFDKLQPGITVFAFKAGKFRRILETNKYLQDYGTNFKAEYVLFILPKDTWQSLNVEFKLSY